MYLSKGLFFKTCFVIASSFLVDCNLFIFVSLIRLIILTGPKKNLRTHPIKLFVRPATFTTVNGPLKTLLHILRKYF